MDYTTTRRSLIVMLASIPLAACEDPSNQVKGKEANMYGLIGKFITVEGKRDELSAILLEGLKDMPGNISYIVANDSNDENTIWVTEIWENSKSHQDSLSLESVQSAIQNGRPLIAGIERISETQPLGGNGI